MVVHKGVAFVVAVLLLSTPVFSLTHFVAGGLGTLIFLLIIVMIGLKS